MAQVHRVEIEGYRSIRDPVVITFPQNRPVVLVGENNVGKSNIVRSLDLVLGERWPGSFTPEDHDYFGRTPKDSGATIRITVDLVGFRDDYGKAVNQLELRSTDGSSTINMIYPTGSTKFPTNKARQQCTCIVVGADRKLQYQLSYTSQWTLLSKLMKKFHKALVADPTRVQALRNHFEKLHQIFEGVPEFAKFSAQLRDEIKQLSTCLQYGLEIDFSAYDPSNYFHALRVLPAIGKDRRNFDELGTGQEQILALGFAYAYAATFASNGEGLLLVIEEPESHLHPLAQEWLASQIHRFLAAGVQILVTTHSPHFIDVRHLNGLVIVRKDEETGSTYTEQRTAYDLAKYCQETNASSAKQETILDYYACHATEEIRAGFFARAVVMVEGPTESLALPVLFKKAGLDLARSGVACVQVGGKGNLAKWWRLFTAYDIPTYVIFDNDASDDGRAEKRQDLLTTLGVPEDAQQRYLAADDFIVEEHLAVFGGAYERTMRNALTQYSELEEKGRAILGTSKPLLARWVADRLDIAGYEPFNLLVEQIRRLTSRTSSGSPTAFDQRQGEELFEVTTEIPPF